MPAANAIRAAVLLLFFLSGLSGLIYEVVWTRQLTVILGNTVYAVSAVLSAFMAGLALGSYGAGRFIDSRKDPLRVYALLELGTGVSGLCVTLLLGQTGPLYARFCQLFSSPALQSLAQYLFAFTLLAIPAALMGATLPVLSRFLACRGSEPGLSLGRLYGVNTLGAAAGCFAAGFLLIGTAGLLRTAQLAAAVNLGVGAAAWLMRNARPESGPRPAAAVGADPGAAAGRRRVLVAAAFAVSGFAALGYEVAWTRILVLYLGNSVYAFSAMLTCFLLGMALGSAAFSRFADRLAGLFVWFGSLQALTGLYMLGLIYLFGHQRGFFLAFADPRPYGHDLPLMFLKTLAVLLAPTFLMGASFPLAGRLYAAGAGTAARSVGRLYAWNTLACVAGSAAAGFLLIPRLGIEKTLLALALLNCAAGAALILAEPAPRRRAKAGGAAALLLAAGLAAFFVPRNVIRGLHESRLAAGDSFLKYAETMYGTVTVVRGPAETRLLADDLEIAGTGLRFQTSQKTLGHLPMLLHPDPRKVFVLGFGGGGTAYAVSTYARAEKIDMTELSRSVIEAAPLLAAVNHGVLSDPRGKLVINDGRNSLLTAGAGYNVISVDLLWPQTAGAGSLYTKEFYELCSRRLEADGLLVEWIHPGFVPAPYLRMVVRTARRVFPYAGLWWSRGFHHLLLVAGKKAPAVDYREFSGKVKAPRTRADLAGLGLDDPAVLPAYFIADGEALDAFAGLSGPVNTDDLPLLEYRLPLNKGSSWAANAAELLALKRSVLPLLRGLARADREKILGNEAALGLVLGSMVKDQAGDKPGAGRLMAEAIRRFPDSPEVKGVYDRSKDAVYFVNYAGQLLMAGDPKGAEQAARKALAIDPAGAYARLRLGEALGKQDRFDEAIAQLNEAVKLAPGAFEPHNELGATLIRKAHAAEAQRSGGGPGPMTRETREAYQAAILHFKEAIRLNPKCASAYNNMAGALMDQGEFESAVQPLNEALRLDPDFAQAHVTLGWALGILGRNDDAVLHFRKALAISPDNLGARKGLERALRPGGR